MLNLITPTGMRHESWELCCKWMARQTYEGPVKWVIVDDGKKAQSVPKIKDWDIVVVRRRPYWQLGQNTQRLNFLTGLLHVDVAHPLVVIEDDEHYRPEYLGHIAGLTNRYNLIGQNGSYKYNVRYMAYKKQNHGWASSLCTMAMRGPMIEKFRRICQTSTKFVDIALWKQNRQAGFRYPEHMVTGIKCMPGRAGLDSGHSPTMKNRWDTKVGYLDADGMMLRQWIGDDAEAYLKFKHNR